MVFLTFIELVMAGKPTSLMANALSNNDRAFIRSGLDGGERRADGRQPQDRRKKNAKDFLNIGFSLLTSSFSACSADGGPG